MSEPLPRSTVGIWCSAQKSGRVGDGLTRGETHATAQNGWPRKIVKPLEGGDPLNLKEYYDACIGSSMEMVRCEMTLARLLLVKKDQVSFMS